MVLCSVEADLVLPAPALRAEDLDRAAQGNRPRGCPSERAPQWAFEQVGDRDAAMSRVAAELGVTWWTLMARRYVSSGWGLAHM